MTTNPIAPSPFGPILAAVWQDHGQEPFITRDVVNSIDSHNLVLPVWFGHPTRSLKSIRDFHRQLVYVAGMNVDYGGHQFKLVRLPLTRGQQLRWTLTRIERDPEVTAYLDALLASEPPVDPGTAVQTRRPRNFYYDQLAGWSADDKAVIGVYLARAERDTLVAIRRLHDLGVSAAAIGVLAGRSQILDWICSAEAKNISVTESLAGVGIIVSYQSTYRSSNAYRTAFIGWNAEGDYYRFKEDLNSVVYDIMSHGAEAVAWEWEDDDSDEGAGNPANININIRIELVDRDQPDATFIRQLVESHRTVTNGISNFDFEITENYPSITSDLDD